MRRAPWIYQPSPEEVAEKKAADKAARAAIRWGVFPWEMANMYRTGAAVRIFVRRAAAEKCAERLNDENPAANLVVRQLRQRSGE